MSADGATLVRFQVTPLSVVRAIWPRAPSANAIAGSDPSRSPNWKEPAMSAPTEVELRPPPADRAGRGGCGRAAGGFAPAVVGPPGPAPAPRRDGAGGRGEAGRVQRRR